MSTFNGICETFCVYFQIELISCLSIIMKSGRVIEVSKSSLVSLKAEIVRKQEEVEKFKGSESYIRPPAKKKKVVVSNPGVDERNARDMVPEEDVDMLQKSRDVLQVKSALYDKLIRGDSVQEDVTDTYLVDFKEKMEKVFSETASKTRDTETNEDESDQQEEYDDDGWIDYVDCLGRTRRCLKEDYSAVKERDDLVRKMLGKESETEESGTVPCEESEPDEQQLEMTRNAAELEKMREKWEQQEKELMNKKNIYYEDVRFDEARSHGVAYYGFSTVDSVRKEQQADFKRMRDETSSKRKECLEAKERRDAMKQARLVAARQRQRARLGLDPLPVPSEDSSEQESSRVEVETAVKPEEIVAELEAASARASHVRPWDIGKEGVKQTARVMNQEEWVEAKRKERISEFAPPSLNFCNQNKRKSLTFSQIDPKPVMLKQHDRLSFKSKDNTEEPLVSPQYAAVPPPSSIQNFKRTQTFNRSQKVNSSTSNMIDSIEAGLEYLRQESENRDKILKNKYPQ